MARVSSRNPFDWMLEGEVGTLIQLLHPKGEQTRLVGGAVRNTLLGLPFSDVDLCTTMHPQAVMDLASFNGYKVVPTGFEHGTVSVIVAGRAFEVTTLREDIDSDGRHAKVRFGTSFEGDAARRDFTINALSVDVHGQIHDYFGGLDDLALRRVRFIGEPRKRIEEDYLRILRFFRFFSDYGVGAPDPEALSACVALRDGLRSLSLERIRQEFVKILVGRRACEVVRTLLEHGLLQILLHGVGRIAAFERFVALEACGVDALLNFKQKTMLRLGVLAVFVRDDVARLAQVLRLSREEIRLLESLFAPNPFAIGAHADKLFQHRLYGGEGAIFAALYEASHAHEIPVQTWAEALKDAYGRTVPKPPFHAQMFMDRGLSGASLGAALDGAQVEWIKNGARADYVPF